MKRITAIVLLLILLTSCAKKDMSCYQIFDALSLGEIHVEVYPYSSDLSNGLFFSRLYLAKEQTQKPNAFAYCDDYYVALGSGTELWELHIFHVISTYDRSSIETMLNSRRDRLQKEINQTLYSETTYERVMQARVFSAGHYAVLAVTDHNDLIQEEILALIQ